MEPKLLISGVCSAFGVICHLILFIKGEWDIYTGQLMATSVTVPAVIYGASAFLGNQTAQSIEFAILFPLSWAAGLFTSIIVYRLFFHRLRHFPGPTSHAISTLLVIPSVLPHFQRWLKYKQFHDKYGDFVRIRPQEISINSAEAVSVIHGPRSKCSKGNWYDSVHPDGSMHFTRNKAYHNKRRRLWDRGFSTKDYEPRIMAHVYKLVSKLSTFAQSGEPMDVTVWMSYFGMDVMADLTYGKSFGLVEAGKPNQVWEKMHTQFAPTTAISTITPWMFRFIMSIPGMSIVKKQWYDICWALVQDRMKMKKEKDDLFTHLTDNEGGGKTADVIRASLSDKDILLDSELAIVAGTDTTSSTLASSLYLLALNPEKLAKLREEIDDAFVTINDFDYESVSKKPYLDGVINEALRLFPPVPAGLQRLTPPEGIHVDGTFIPGNTFVNTPTWVIHRDERNYVQPNDFLPERWATQPDLILKKEAFFPFSAGVYSCAGRPLAMKELRITLAAISKTFDWDFADKASTVKAFSDSNDSKIKDFFTLNLPACEMIFKARTK